MLWTQPTSGGAVTALRDCCANCIETSRPQQWGPDLPNFSLIHSVMDYSTTVWNPYVNYNSEKIEKVPRRAARFVKNR